MIPQVGALFPLGLASKVIRIQAIVGAAVLGYLIQAQAQTYAASTSIKRGAVNNCII